MWKNNSMKENEMDFKLVNDMQHIKTTYTSDIVLETMQFWDFPTSELGGCRVFWESNGWGNDFKYIITCI